MAAQIRVLLALIALCALPALAVNDITIENGVIQTTNAQYRIYLPQGEAWNGSLVVYAPGYTPVTRSLAIPDDQLVLDDGNTITTAMNKLGYAFAVTSYRATGLVVVDGVGGCLQPGSGLSLPARSTSPRVSGPRLRRRIGHHAGHRAASGDL